MSREQLIAAEVERIAYGRKCFNGTPLDCWRETCKGWDGTFTVVDDLVIIQCECGDAKRYGKWRRRDEQI